MTTAGGLLFGGDTAGRFRAYDAETGAVLWEVNLGSHVTGFPATFAVNGKQYVADQHRRDAEHVRPRDADAGGARGNGEQSLRVRAAGLTRNARGGLWHRPLAERRAAGGGRRYFLAAVNGVGIGPRCRVPVSLPSAPSTASYSTWF